MLLANNLHMRVPGNTIRSLKVAAEKLAEKLAENKLRPHFPARAVQRRQLNTNTLSHFSGSSLSAWCIVLVRLMHTCLSPLPRVCCKALTTCS